MDGISGTIPFIICLVVRYDKCTFGANKVSFLGHHITLGKVHPLSPQKAAAIQISSHPLLLKNTKNSWASTHRYSCLLYASCKDILKHLRYCPLQESAFCNAKNALSIAGTPTFQVPHASLLLSTNASNVTIGAVLKHVVNGSSQPLAFFSNNCPRQSPATLPSTMN
ncbi:uncharacterized protein [Palaemon carinicauda]|uniref:uncharacterized protein n=1 Tax=Palaemon carinicauda TaxID=392227 RepID=UPI0035B58FFC